MFEIREQSIETSALSLRYHLNPWDEPSVGAPVATISGIEIRNDRRAGEEFAAFRDWCTRLGIVLVSCRLPHASLAESGFLETQGFRFIELNYRPELTALQTVLLGTESEFVVRKAAEADAGAIAGMAGRVFQSGRFHSDPMIDRTIGGLRYKRWIENAFRSTSQTVLKCGRDEVIEAFFVVECPEADQRFWSLVGLAPGLGGRGIGTRVWRAMLQWHRSEGAERVVTSISSLNGAIFNLYVKLGFRFPSPEMTLHWCPGGRLTGPP